MKAEEEKLKPKKWKLIRNKYFLVLLGFTVWMAFFDSNDLFRQYKLRSRYRDLKREKQLLITEIEETKEQLKQLYNKNDLERFAREQYFFKRPNEEIFVVVTGEE